MKKRPSIYYSEEQGCNLNALQQFNFYRCLPLIDERNDDGRAPCLVGLLVQCRQHAGLFAFLVVLA